MDLSILSLLPRRLTPRSTQRAAEILRRWLTTLGLENKKNNNKIGHMSNCLQFESLHHIDSTRQESQNYYYKSIGVICSLGARFSKAPETFRARNAIFSRFICI